MDLQTSYYIIGFLIIMLVVVTILMIFFAAKDRECEAVKVCVCPIVSGSIVSLESGTNFLYPDVFAPTPEAGCTGAVCKSHYNALVATGNPKADGWNILKIAGKAGSNIQYGDEIVFYTHDGFIGLSENTTGSLWADKEMSTKPNVPYTGYHRFADSTKIKGPKDLTVANGVHGLNITKSSTNTPISYGDNVKLSSGRDDRTSGYLVKSKEETIKYMAALGKQNKATYNSLTKNITGDMVYMGLPADGLTTWKLGIM